MSDLDVLFYVPSITPLLTGRGQPPGGAETQIRLLSRALASLGVRVGVTAYQLPDLPSEDRGVEVVARPPRHADPAREAAAIAALFRRARSRVVVTRQAGAHTGLVALATRAARRRFVYSIANLHDLDFGTFERRRWKRASFEVGLRLADVVVAQTDEQRERCERKLRRSPPVIRSLAEPAPPRQTSPRAFLWASRLASYKQPFAYLDLAAAVPEAEFWMVAVPGDDPELLAAVHERASRLPNLRLLGPRPRAELLALMDQAIAVVSTSSSEGMPNIWLEGWTRGVPALTLSHDPDALVTRHGLGQSAGGDPARFAAAARSLWHERDDKGLAQRCRAYVAAHHSPEVVARQWVAALDLVPGDLHR